MKLPVHIYLDERNIPYEARSFPPETEKGAANVARVLGFAEGYVIGSIPAFSWQPPGFRSFLEASLVSEPILGTGVGQRGEEIMITPQNLIKASKAIVVNLTDRNKSVFAEQ